MKPGAAGNIARQLQGDFVVVDLGSAAAADFTRRLPDVRGAITLVEIDAQASGTTLNEGYFKRIALSGGVAGSAGRRTFHKRMSASGSSFLEAKPERIRDYGLDRLYRSAGDIEIVCRTLSDLLAEQSIDQIDFLKTDLEGLDLEVLRSAPELVRNCLAVQSELRFQPFHAGEPSFGETLAYMSSLGHELITMHPEVWKYATAHQRSFRDGRLVWADAIFFLPREQVKEQRGPERAGRAFTKQILLAKMLRLHNFAEFLYESNCADIPEEWQGDLQALVSPGFRLGVEIANRMAGVRGAGRLLALIGRLSGAVNRTVAVDGASHLGPSTL